jgi:hypothetical protein
MSDSYQLNPSRFYWAKQLILSFGSGAVGIQITQTVSISVKGEPVASCQPPFAAKRRAISFLVFVGIFFYHAAHEQRRSD